MREREESEHEAHEERRRFLLRTTGAVGAVVAALLVTPPLGFLLHPLRRQEPQRWWPVGSLRDFAVGETVSVRIRDPAAFPWAGFAADEAVHLRREREDGFIAMSAYCTHVGCPVRWLEGAQMFMCPCHGGAFYRDGTVAAGPPPRPLERHGVRVRGDLVEISTRRRPARRSGRA